MEVFDRLIANNEFPQAVVLLSERSNFVESKVRQITEKIHYREGVSRQFIADKNRPDLYEYFPEGKIYLHSIDTIRSMTKKAYEKPFIFTTKIFVIYAADRMSLSASASLLKILEEPPADTLFILTSNKRKNLAETILSRCKIFFLSEETSVIENFFSEKILFLNTSRLYLLNEFLNNKSPDKNEIKEILNSILLAYRDRFLLEHDMIDYMSFSSHKESIRKLPYLSLHRVLDVINKAYEALEKGTNKSFCLEWTLLELEHLIGLNAV
ncbi:MAG: hypothetical protein RR599_04850 [Victivallaceae bacterium]